MSNHLALVRPVDRLHALRKPFAQCAEEFLEHLKLLPVEEVDLPKKKLAAKLDVGEATLYKYVNHLRAVGKLGGDWTVPLSVALHGSRDTRAPLRVLSTTDNEVSRETPETPEKWVDTQEPNDSDTGDSETVSRDTPKKVVSPVSRETVPVPLVKERTKEKEKPRVEKADAPAAADGTIQLPKMGKTNHRAIAYAAMSDKIEQDDRAKLLWCKGRKGWDVFYTGLLTGTMACVKKQYKALWSAVVKGKMPDATETNAAGWEKAAVAILKTDLSVEEYLRRAQDAKPAKQKIIPLAWLGSPNTVAQVVAWTSPEERRLERLKAEQKQDFDGLTYAEVLERTAKAGI